MISGNILQYINSENNKKYQETLSLKLEKTKTSLEGSRLTLHSKLGTTFVVCIYIGKLRVVGCVVSIKS